MVQAGRLAVVDPLWPPRPQPALPPKQGPCGGQQGHPRTSGASPRQGPKRSPGRHACGTHRRVRHGESSRNPSSFCKSVHYIKCYGPETLVGSIGFTAIHELSAAFQRQFQPEMLHAGCLVRTSWLPQPAPARDEATAVWSAWRSPHPKYLYKAVRR